MKILLADDEKLSLELLEDAVRQACPDSKIFPFRKADELLDFASETLCDVAFLDIEMPTMTGVEIAKKLKEIYPSTNIVFVTGYSEYMGIAFSMHISGYILKPVTKEAVERELENLRYPVNNIGTKRVRIQTFGDFEIFIDNVPAQISRSKSKEILAYLVDRNGASVTPAAIAAVVFEDKEYDRSMQKQMQVYISQLISSLKKYKADDIIIKSYNALAINKKKIECDYYDFLELKPYAINSYFGEYMSNYSWAEMTTGYLTQKNELI